MTINIPTLVSQTITNGVTAYAPSEDAVFDALALKADVGSYQPLDADLTSIAGLTTTSAYLRRSAANTYVLDSYTTTAGNMPSTSITAKVLTGGSFPESLFATTDTILGAFEILDSLNLPAAFIVGNGGDGTSGTTMVTGKIIVGSATNAPLYATLSLSGTGGTFGLDGTGILTMPNAATGTRGLLTSTDWNTFNNKQAALVSATNIKTINGSTILGSGDLVVSGGGITIGTTTITSGTTTRILYNNGGVVGEYTLTGTGTIVVMATAPTFTTSTATTAITATTAADDILETLTNNSSGTPAVGYGASRIVKLKSTTTDSQDAVKEIYRWITATHASRKAEYLMQLSVNGTLTDAFKITNSGSQIEHHIIGTSGNFPVIRLYSGVSQKGSWEANTDMYFTTWAAAGSIIYFRAGVAGAGMNLSTTALTLDNAVNLVFNTSTGTKIGTATSQKFSFWNKTPIIQPTTGITAAAFVSNTSLIANDTATFGGYTIGQIAAALINTGILA